MKCKWCEYVAVEGTRSDGKPREPFEDLKLHVNRTHPAEYREWTKKSWFAKLDGWRRIKKIRARMRDIG